MARRRRDRSGEKAEALVKLGFVLLVLLALGIGGLGGFAQALTGLVTIIIVVALGGGLLALAVLIGVRLYKRNQASRAPDPFAASFGWQGLNSQPLKASDRTGVRTQDIKPETAAKWTKSSIRTALDEIDWYQFEKFCAALLEADGFTVERKGGAHPDGGVDLVVEKAGSRALIQCKHWRTWHVKEDVVRGMLGSMTDSKVTEGAIYTLKGWTEPAAQFATKHAITLVNGDELAQSAAFQLSAEKLEAVLRPREHHCPKCESSMLWKTGNFTPFWGCSRYPRCRGKINHSGAR